MTERSGSQKKKIDNSVSETRRSGKGREKEEAKRKAEKGQRKSPLQVKK